ncbi:MAG: hypothetical protein KC419_10835, partial [Anaerolineales bacterium]|nr:hypothetical protein [Anaerolineales bacterium]
MKFILSTPFFILVITTLVGCQPAAAQSAAAVDSADVGIIQEPETAVLPTPTLALPVVTYDEAPIQPTNMPSFALADPDELTREAVPTMTVPTETAVSPTAVPTATNTPQPTFTPPALPFTSNEEHYWFRRPIPEGGTVWTDKVYPYGSTKGGTLRPHHGVEFYV